MCIICEHDKQEAQERVTKQNIKRLFPNLRGCGIHALFTGNVSGLMCHRLDSILRK